MASYTAFSLFAATAFAIALWLADGREQSFGAHWRLAFASIWGVENPLDRPFGNTTTFSLSATLVVLGVLLPVFLLGSFVFKILRHDPVVWRRQLSVINYRDEGAALVVRFYNGTHSTLADVSVEASIRVSSLGEPLLIANRHLPVLQGPNLVDVAHFLMMETGTPFTVRIPLGDPRFLAEQFRDEPRIPVKSPGQDWAYKNKVSVAILVKGTVVSTGEPFASLRDFPASEIQFGHPQEIDVNLQTQPDTWNGWSNFDGVERLYVFGYGSLVNSTSAERTFGYPVNPEKGPTPAILHGYRRCWNVGSDVSRRQDRQYHRADGSRWQGILISMGLERGAEADACYGAVYEVSNSDLWRLDAREVDYDRQDVSAQVGWPHKPEHARVFTYVPKSDARDRASSAGRNGVITESYLALMRDGYESLGKDWLTKHVDSLPDHGGFLLLPITWSATPAPRSAGDDDVDHVGATG